MCGASAVLAYGLTVKVTELCLLSSALHKTEPARLAIDLILARRRQGRLETATDLGKGAVRAISVEVWTMVKTELTKEALADECLDLFYRHGPDATCDCWIETAGDYDYDCDDCDDHDDDCDDDDDDDDGWPPNLVPPCAGSFDIKLAVTACDGASYDFYNRAGLEQLVDRTEKLVSQLLAKFGLYLVDSTLLSEDEIPYLDLDAAWPIAVLPPPTSTTSRLTARSSGPCAVVDIYHEVHPPPSLVRLSPAALDLPADARARFARFLSTFPWLETTGGASLGGAPPRSVEGRSVRARKDAERRSRSEPGWMLLNVGWSCG
ncbi:hypothetical protein JCM9279_007005 [Rhodotorula babjevae]